MRKVTRAQGPLSGQDTIPLVCVLGPRPVPVPLFLWGGVGRGGHKGNVVSAAAVHPAAGGSGGSRVLVWLGPAGLSGSQKDQMQGERSSPAAAALPPPRSPASRGAPVSAGASGRRARGLCGLRWLLPLLSHPRHQLARPPPGLCVSFSVFLLLWGHLSLDLGPTLSQGDLISRPFL